MNEATAHPALAAFGRREVDPAIAAAVANLGEAGNALTAKQLGEAIHQARTAFREGDGSHPPHDHQTAGTAAIGILADVVPEGDALDELVTAIASHVEQEWEDVLDEEEAEDDEEELRA